MNTIDILGEEEIFRNIVERTITEFEDSEIEEIGTVSSGLTDELRADLAENPSKYEGRVVAIQAMSRDKKEHTLRHPFIVQFRDDKPARDCTIEETFS